MPSRRHNEDIAGYAVTHTLHNNNLGPAGQQQPLQPLGLGNNDKPYHGAPASTTTHMPAPCNEDAQQGCTATMPRQPIMPWAGMFLPSFSCPESLFPDSAHATQAHGTQALHENALCPLPSAGYKAGAEANAVVVLQCII